MKSNFLVIMLALAFVVPASAEPPQQHKKFQAQDPMAIVGQPQKQVRPPLSSVKKKADQRAQEKPQTAARPEPKKVQIEVEAHKRADK